MAHVSSSALGLLCLFMLGCIVRTESRGAIPIFVACVRVSFSVFFYSYSSFLNLCYYLYLLGDSLLDSLQFGNSMGGI